MVVTSVERALVIFLAGEAWEARSLAVSVALTAASLGDEVHLALSGEPLRLFASSRLGQGGPAGQDEGALDAMLAEGRRDLGVRVVACPSLAREAGLEPAALVPPLDALESLPSLWRKAQSGRALSF